MPSVQGIDAFDHGFDVPADYDALFGTPTAVTTPLYQGRLNSLEINSPGNEGVRKTITGSPSRGWMGFPLRVPGNPSGSSMTVCAIHSVTSNIQARLAVSAAGNLFAFIGGGADAGSFALSADTWYWVEMIYNVIGSTHQLFWRVNGVDQTTATVAATGSDSIDYSQVISLTGNGTLTWHAGGYWAWGSAAADDDWLGEPSLGIGYQRLAGPVQLGSSPSDLYITPQGNVVEIRSVHLNNPSGAEVEVSLSIGTDAESTRILDRHPLAAGGSFHGRRFTNHSLAAGEKIQGFCDVAATAVVIIDGYVRAL